MHVGNLFKLKAKKDNRLLVFNLEIFNVRNKVINESTL